ncbi:MAG: hypothetical protein IT423_07700 [Pirellulaceae bacterium]|nr:hypothetical protein [Pirellulaceae bacterium]
MNKSMRNIVLLCAVMSMGWILASPACAQATAAKLLPPSTVVYVEGVGSRVLLDHPLTNSVVTSNLFKEIWRSPDVMKARGGITLVEVALGERLTTALDKATAGGWALAIDAQSKAIALLTHTRDREVTSQLYKKLFTLATNDAKNKGLSVKQETYRHIQAYEYNGVVVAGLDEWLLVSNKGELAKAIVDNQVTPSNKSLADQPAFATFIQQQGADATDRSEVLATSPLIRAWADLDKLRAAGAGKKVFQRPDENFGAELILGGVLAGLRSSATINASLSATSDRLTLRSSLPDAPAIQSDEYQFFFGKVGQGAAPHAIELDGPQVTVSTFRDVAELWRRAGDLFGQRTNDQLAQAETTLTTLFSGRDFTEDILAAIEPGLQLVAMPQEFGSPGAPIPHIKLPAFALVTKLRQPAQMQPQLKRIFMSLIGFLNIAGAMEQQPQLDIDSVKIDNATLVTSTYTVDVDKPRDWLVPIQYNFSPTLAMVDDYAILSSTRALSERIVQQLKPAVNAANPVGNSKPIDADALHGSRTNTRLHIDGALITQSLAANRDQLISQNMVEKGHTQSEAAQEIDVLLRITELVKDLKVRLDVSQAMMLDVELGVNVANLAQP